MRETDRERDDFWLDNQLDWDDVVVFFADTGHIWLFARMKLLRALPLYVCMEGGVMSTFDIGHMAIGLNR